MRDGGSIAHCPRLSQQGPLPVVLGTLHTWSQDPAALALTTTPACCTESKAPPQSSCIILVLTTLTACFCRQSLFHKSGFDTGIVAYASLKCLISGIIGCQPLQCLHQINSRLCGCPSGSDMVSAVPGTMARKNAACSARSDAP